MQLPVSLLYFGVVEQKQKSWLASANAGLAILAFINLFSYLDRYVVSGVLESLKHSDLGLSDTNLGSLMSGFLVVYTLLAPIFGALGDRRSRPRLIALGVACWSFATALSGFAVNFLTLFAARAAVGVGEAAYVTIAPSLLSDYFPVRQRGRVMAIFFCAIPVGSALGYVVGGLVDKHYGWRAAFFVAGVPGLLLAALCLLLRDPPRGIQDQAAGAKAAPSKPRASISRDAWRTYGRLLRNKPYALTVLGYAAYTFAIGGLAYWMPAFLERARGIPRSEATVNFGTIVVDHRIRRHLCRRLDGRLFCEEFAAGVFVAVSCCHTGRCALCLVGPHHDLNDALHGIHGDGATLFVPLYRSDQRRHHQSRHRQRARHRNRAERLRYSSARRCVVAVDGRRALGRLLAAAGHQDSARGRAGRRIRVGLGRACPGGCDAGQFGGLVKVVRC